MRYPPVDERDGRDEPADIITKDRAYWYALGFISGNPIMGGLLLSYLEDGLPPNVDPRDEKTAVDAMCLMFAESFHNECPHGDTALGFVQWMALVMDPQVGPPPPTPLRVVPGLAGADYD
ncbi:hypothetical protein AB0P21_09630 [Kribbella sp. NPDC056861]|uniref:hypothetical protein n=1 Tax=Kribbella sp. NPDC056861 TaxID=3154857 RepID=UPI003428F0D6